MSQVSLCNVTKVYPNGTKAVMSVNLGVENREFMVLVGSSGCGKTTLLNIIGGLDRPSSGEAVVDNTSISLLTNAQATDFRLKKIGFVFQAHNLIETLTVVENAEYVALLQNMPAKRRDHEVSNILKDLGLQDCLHQKPSQLSDEQQQRVAIARALLAHPKIILADEPIAHLDSKTGSSLIDLMHAMSQNLNITFILTTHDKMVMDKAKTLINLRDGKII